MVSRKEPVVNISTGPLLAVELDGRGSPGRQLETQLRALIRARSLPVGTRLPSTRSFAVDLGVSRGVVVRAFDQLAAEGYIVLRRGAPPVVAAIGREPDEVCADPDVPIAGARFNLRPDLPDLGVFPRAAWLAACRASFRRAADADLAYGEPFGALALRRSLAPFLARTRGVVAAPERTGVFAGSSQALLALASALRAEGATRIAVEEPSHRWRSRVLAASGLQLAPVRVDRDGLCGEELPDVDAVVVSPDHQFPLGVVLAPDRRRALVEWADAGNRLVIEHDYDAHFRYDTSRGGALQGLAPEHVAYAGSASGLLAPTLRLGWAVVPARLVVPLADGVFATTISTPRLAQLALAELIDRGALDRHLRAARAAYARRRRVAVEALARELPAATVGGAARGLFVHVALPDGCDEAAVLTAARARAFVLDGVREHACSPQQPALVLGFAGSSEPALELAAAELATVASAA
jgi:GntR family transcriptional regulator/MocR family aminotransferase